MSFNPNSFFDVQFVDRLLHFAPLLLIHCLARLLLGRTADRIILHLLWYEPVSLIAHF